MMRSNSFRVHIDPCEENKEKCSHDKHSWRQIQHHALDPIVSSIKKKWNTVFLISCVVAVMLDPLFFYIPIINEEKKCLAMDTKLKNYAITFRAITDLSYVLHIIIIIRDSALSVSSGDSNKSDSVLRKEKIMQVIKSTWCNVLIDILALIPIPQVGMTRIFFLRMKGSKSLGLRKIFNFILLGQYVPRLLFRIYMPYKSLIENPDPKDITGQAWVKGAFNFFLYTLASHVLGAFWYLFSVERETACWQIACKENKCVPTTFYCGGVNTPASNLTFLTSQCPINPPNSTVFDFGIFAGALKPGIVGSTDFPRKLFNCFCWGLRNLSSYGSNLQTSTYVWENFFVGCITMVGLLLFLYLIGTLQVYMQLPATRTEDSRRKRTLQNKMEKERKERKSRMRMEKKMKKKEAEITKWLVNSGIKVEEIQSYIAYVKTKLADQKGVDIKNLLAIFNPDTKRSIKRRLCLKTLKKVPTLRSDIPDRVYDIIMDNLEPEVFPKDSTIIEKGMPHSRMILFTQGTVVTAENTSIQERVIHPSRNIHELLGKGDIYGQELLEWELEKYDFSGQSPQRCPTSSKTLKARTQVEALVLEATRLSEIVRYWETAAVLQEAWRRAKNEKNTFTVV